MAETRRSIGEKEMSEKEAIVSRARDIKEFHNTVGQRAASPLGVAATVAEQGGVRFVASPRWWPA